MNKVLAHISVFILAIQFSFSQTPTWLFEGGTGSANAENAKAICADGAGNIYVTGSFANTVDFDFSASTANLVSNGSNDIFIASYTSAGAFRWAVRAGGTGNDNSNPAGGICTDGTNVYVTGSYNGAGTMFGATSLTPNGGSGQDAFVAKLNASTGAWVWAVSLGGTGNVDYGVAMCLDPSANPYVLGSFNLTLSGACANVSAGGSDIFVSKLNPATGACIWTSNGGSTGNDGSVGGGICYDPVTTEIIVGSNFTTGTATFGSFSIPLTGGIDLCVLELNSSTGAWLGAVGSGSGTNDDAVACVLDPATGDVMVVGAFTGNLTLPGGIPLTASSAGFQDAWVGRYSIASNSFVWAKTATGASNDRANGVTVDGSGRVLVIGQYISNPTNFGAFSLTNTNSGGFDDAFVVAYSTSTGTEQWATKNTNSGVQPSANNARAITPGGGINYWIAGQYAQGCTFGALGAMNSAGFNDWYVAKFSVPPGCSSPTLNLSGQTNVLCNGGSTGSATVSATGGAPFTYTWSPSGGNAGIASGLSAGVYTCVTTNSCGLTASRTVTITQPASALNTSTAITNVLCNGGSTGSATVSASGGTPGYTYLWSTAQTTSVITALNAGVRTVTVTDANGCTSIKSITITQPATALSTSTAITNVLCNGGSNGSATVTASGGTGAYTYLWSSAQTTSVITGLNAGVRTVTVTDANGCTSIKSITITQPATAVSTSTAITNVLCNGGSNGSATVTASGGIPGYTYLWSTAATTSVIAAQTSGVKTVTVTDANGCTSVNSVNITQPASALNTSTFVTNVLCNGGSTGSATISASGGTPGYTYLWSSAQTTSVISGLNAGVRTVTVTDANGCTSIKSITITQPATIVSSSTAAINVLCNGGSTGSATVTASGGTGAYSYLWSSAQTTSVISGLNAGVRTVTVTDANGCTSINSVNITQPGSAVSSSTSVVNVLCNGGNNGSATVTASGGTPGYTYLWSTAATTSVISSQNSGVKTVTVTDANGCTNINSVNITQPASALNTSTAITNVLCNGGTGSATITASGGTAGYTYLWSNAATTSVIASVLPALYTATVTDANGCTSIKSVSITQPSAITASVVSTTAPGCSLNNGAITVSASGGTGSLSYSWSPIGGTSATGTSLTAGSYTCTITDANNCTLNISQSLSNPNSPTVTASTNNAGCGTQTNGSITLSVTGGTPSYSYSWSPSVSTTSVAITLGAGIYNATVTDANNCITTQSYTLTAFPLPTITATNSNSVMCLGGSVTLAGMGAATYTWSGGIIDNTAFTPTATSNYTVTGTDGNGCNNTAITSVTVNPLPTISANTSNTLICTGQSATLTASGASTYTFNPGGAGSSIVVSPTVNTTYTITGTNSFGCVNTSTFTQLVDPCLGLSSVALAKEEINIYPNPFNNKITVTSNATKQSLQIFNSIGELIFKTTIENKDTEIDLTDQSAGIYFIRVGNGTKKIIKQ